MQSIATALLGFTAVAALLTITPGLDTALVLRTAASEGSRPALWSGVGIIAGCFVWATLVAVGLGVVLMASEFAYGALRWGGAAYLVYMGVKMILRPRTAFEVPVRSAKRRRGPFVRGALTNLLNPKVGVFYLSFLPQFIPAGVSAPPFTLLLAAIHGLLGLLWFLALIAATRPLSIWLRRPSVIRRLDRGTGAVFVAFGARLAVESRHA